MNHHDLTAKSKYYILDIHHQGGHEALLSLQQLTARAGASS
jgi:hypothetical protein